MNNLKDSKLEALQTEYSNERYAYKKLCSGCNKYNEENHDYSKCRKENCLRLSLLDLFFNIEQEKHEVLGTCDKI